MTFEQKILELLCNNGMFEDDAAKEVLAMMKADKANDAMANRWSDDIEGYPKPVLSILWVSAQRTALQWIDANCPKAWYRPMFES